MINIPHQHKIFFFVFQGDTIARPNIEYFSSYSRRIPSAAQNKDFYYPCSIFALKYTNFAPDLKDNINDLIVLPF
jgi:hypothetical protein